MYPTYIGFQMVCNGTVRISNPCLRPIRTI
jgi:hypothetical protein